MACNKYCMPFILQQDAKLGISSELPQLIWSFLDVKGFSQIFSFPGNVRLHFFCNIFIYNTPAILFQFCT